jgi:hypothetical protein
VVYEASKEAWATNVAACEVGPKRESAKSKDGNGREAWFPVTI